MRVKNATTFIFFDARHPKKDGTCSISIRVTFNGQKKYYTTGISLSSEDFAKVQGEKPRQPLKETALELRAFENKAAKIIKELPVFTWLQFEKLYLSNNLVKDTISQAFGEYSKKLAMEGRIGTAESYDCAAVSLEKFKPKAKFTDVTVDFLNSYERWMLKNEKSITTVGIYLRSLRALFNIAIEAGIIPKEYYPFGKDKYEIPTANNHKKALTIGDISAIYKHHVPDPNSTAAIAKDMWLFIYFCNGINMKDVALLKYENIQGDFLEFIRAKTIHTKRVYEKIRIHLLEQVKYIIDRRGNKNKNDGNYIFPILTKGLSPERQRQLIKQFNVVVNDHMNVIANKLGIEANCTTYTARHTFATILKRSGYSIEYISEALGHSSVKTTRSYLASFEDDKKIEAAKALADFK
jgi:integrase/recombinase XerD